MTSFTNVFTGATILGSSVSYKAYTLTASIQLAWPLDINTNQNTVANIMGVTANAGLFMTMPSAQQVSAGQGVLFANLGANTYTVKDYGGNTILTVASGTMWFLYLTANSTDAGVWGSVQFGAGTSSATAAALAGYGLKAITTTLNQTMPVTTTAVNFTADATYRAQAYVWTGGAGVASLTSPVTLGNDWFFNLRNGGTGDLVVTPLAGTIDGNATLTLAPDESVIIVSSGTVFYTFGLTPSEPAPFDYIAIPIPGAGTYVLSGTELNRLSYSFTGILTGTRTIEIPATVQEYWTSNNTTGAYELYVKTNAQVGTGVRVPQGLTRILRCDAINAIPAETTYIAPETPTTAGTNTVTITVPAPFPSAYYEGLTVDGVVGVTNTAAATLNVNGISAVAIQKNGLPLVANDQVATDRVRWRYSATTPSFELLTPARTPVISPTGTLASGGGGTTNISTSPFHVSITGTNGISALGTAASGTTKVVTFTGALILTYNATSLILPGGANITTVAGDSMLVQSLGSGNWKVHFYQPATAAAMRTLAGLGTAAVQNTGTSGANVPLMDGANTWSALQTFSSGIAFANETLSTYDEGTWTAAWSLASGSITSYTNQTMSFTRIGRLCWVGGGLYVNVVSSPAGSNTRITGLPFTVGQAGGGVYMNPPLEVLPRGWNAALVAPPKLAALSGTTTASLYLMAATGGMTETNSGAVLNQASNNCFIGGTFSI